MKKYVSVMLAICMVLLTCFALSACSEKKEDKIQTALQGKWSASWIYQGKQISRYYVFEGNKYRTGGVTNLGRLNEKSGRFEVRDAVIYLTPDDGSDATDLKYSFDESSGVVTLWWSSDIQLKKSL